MTFTTEDYLKTFSRRTVAQLRDETLMLQLVSSADTGPWASGQAHQTFIPVPNWTPSGSGASAVGVQATTRARKGNWAGIRYGDQSILTFERSGGFATTNVVPWEDAMEVPWPVLEQTRARQTYEMRRQIDRALWAAMLAGVASSDTTRIGTATSVYITPTFPYNVAGAAGKLIYDAVRQFALKCKVNKVDSNTSDNFGRKYMIMHPACFQALMDYMLDQKFSWDRLTENVLAQNTVLGGGAYEGRLHGVDILSYDGITAPTAGTTAGTNDWPILCGVREAWRGAVRPTIGQYFAPATNQITDNPAHIMRQAGDYGLLEVHGSLQHRFNLRTQ